MRTRLYGTIFAAGLVASGCTSSGPYWSRQDRSSAERNEMQERIASLEAQLVAEGGRCAAWQSEIEGLKRELERYRALSGPPAASPPEALEPPDAALAPRDRPQIEEAELEFEEPAAAGSNPGEAEAGIQALYDRSLDFLQQQRLAEAEDGFVRFLAAHADSDLADNAQFWLAECALRRGDTASALTAFRAVVELYPEGNKVPDALLKVGFCLGVLGDPESATTVYRELLLQFPESAAAETARQRLDSR